MLPQWQAVLVLSFCSIGPILPSRPTHAICWRAQRQSRMARLRATALAARSVLDGREHDGMIERVGAPIHPPKNHQKASQRLSRNELPPSWGRHSALDSPDEAAQFACDRGRYDRRPLTSLDERSKTA